MTASSAAGVDLDTEAEFQNVAIEVGVCQHREVAARGRHFLSAQFSRQVIAFGQAAVIDPHHPDTRRLRGG